MLLLQAFVLTLFLLGAMPRGGKANRNYKSDFVIIIY